MFNKSAQTDTKLQSNNWVFFRFKSEHEFLKLVKDKSGPSTPVLHLPVAIGHR